MRASIRNAYEPEIERNQNRLRLPLDPGDACDLRAQSNEANAVDERWSVGYFDFFFCKLLRHTIIFQLKEYKFEFASL